MARSRSSSPPSPPPPVGSPPAAPCASTRLSCCAKSEIHRLSTACWQPNSPPAERDGANRCRARGARAEKEPDDERWGGGSWVFYHYRTHHRPSVMGLTDVAPEARGRKQCQMTNVGGGDHGFITIANQSTGLRDEDHVGVQRGVARSEERR